MHGRAEKSQRLFKVAESQQGYFTSAEAKRLGYDYRHQHFHVSQGNWIRVDHGIYRLKKFPAAKHEDLMRWWLWSRKKAVLSPRDNACQCRRPRGGYLRALCARRTRGGWGAIACACGTRSAFGRRSRTLVEADGATASGRHPGAQRAPASQPSATRGALGGAL